MSVDCSRLIFSLVILEVYSAQLLRNVGNEIEIVSLFVFAVRDQELPLHCLLRIYLVRD